MLLSRCAVLAVCGLVVLVAILLNGVSLVAAFSESTSDATWTLQESGTTSNLTGLVFVDEKRGWAVGEAGTIVSTKDGGEHWVTHVRDTGVNFMAVDFVDAERGWVVGDDLSILATADGG